MLKPTLSHGVRATGVLALLAALSCSAEEPVAPAPAPAVVQASTPPAAIAVATETSRTTIEAPAAVDAEPGPRIGIDLWAEVPDDAVGYFECTSIEELEVALLRFATMTNGALQGFEAAAVLLTLPLASVGVDPSRIDRHAPIGIAFAPVAGELFPAPIVIAPARDSGPIVSSAAALTARRMRARRIDGGYVVIEHENSAPTGEGRGNASVTRSLPEGLVRGRFATQTFHPLIAPKLYECATELNESYRLSRPRQSSSDLYQFDADFVIDAMRTCSEITFGAALDGDRVTLSMRTFGSETGAEPSTGATTALAQLCHHIDLGDPLSALVTFEQGSTSARLFSALGSASALLEEYEIYGGAARGTALPLGKIGAALDRMLESFHGGAAVSFQLEPGKAHVAVYLAAKDPLRARDAISLLLSKCDLDEWGFEMALPIRSMVDRTLVEDYTVRFDTRRLDFDQRAKMREGFKTLLGDSTLHMKVATSGDHVLILLGGDTSAVNQRIRKFDAKGRASIDIVRGTQAVEGAQHAMVVHTDFVKLFGQFAGLREVSRGHSLADAYREISREAGEAEAPFVFWTSVQGADRLTGTSFLLPALTTGFDAFKGAGL